MELFKSEDVGKKVKKPLADRMRPRRLDEFVGQEHLLGEGKFLKILLEKKEIPSMIFWGPPGVGKTSLGWLIGRHLDIPFVPLSAVTIGVKEVKEIIRNSKLRKTILFIDEFHRFNKLQQDTFLPCVEGGEIILIGATTENPSFEIVAPLLSRMKVLTLSLLTEDDIVTILDRALKQDSELNSPPMRFEGDVLKEIASLVTGDARKALNLLEVSHAIAVRKNAGRPVIDHEIVQEAYQKRVLVYDKKGEMHYDLISALHKSMRGSDPDAALYWLARMIEAGEDPLYIARRMTRFASEDVGNADPQALSISLSAMEAFNFLGAPEGYLALAQACVYLSCCEKSNAVYTAYNQAAADVRNLPEYPVPLHIRNAPTKLMKELGYGHDYLYPHDYEDGLVSQEYLPEALGKKRYYHPTDRGYEMRLGEFLAKVRKVRGDRER
ncbi:MAG: replication-associated recombination protein A [Syntrophorhabdales bacterium]